MRFKKKKAELQTRKCCKGEVLKACIVSLASSWVCAHCNEGQWVCSLQYRFLQCFNKCYSQLCIVQQQILVFGKLAFFRKKKNLKYSSKNKESAYRWPENCFELFCVPFQQKLKVLSCLLQLLLRTSLPHYLCCFTIYVAKPRPLLYQQPASYSLNSDRMCRSSTAPGYGKRCATHTEAVAAHPLRKGWAACTSQPRQGLPWFLFQ